MNDEGNNENSNMNDDSTPSTAPDVMPSGGATLGQAAKQKAKNTVKKGWDSFKNAVGRGLKALWKFLPLQVKIIVIVILCILIVLAALLLMGMIEEGTNTVTTGVDNFMSDSKDIDKDAKSLYEDKASLIKVKLKDINAMYDKFIDEEKGGAETQTLMKYKIGTKDVKEDNKEKRIVNVEDKLPLYKHILLTEKYNFNNVDWKKFSHNASAGEDIKDFKEDKERGLKYPDTKKNNAGDPKEVKLDKFIDLTLPYLQTWYIPLAMSNASVLNGTESDNNRAPAFSYNIIKEAYSNIVANWYELKKHTTVTRYYTYDEVKKHDMVTVEVIEREYENGAKNYSLRLGSSQTFEDSRIPKNTRTTSGIVGGTVDPMKEEAVSQKDEYTSHFYIKEADVFDAKIVNQFNYQVYSDSDAAKRRNADSTNESTATYAKTMSTEDINKKGENAMYGLTVDSNGNISGANLDKASRFGNAIPQNDPTNTTKRTTAYSYSVTFKQYTDYENGLEHTVTRIWKDKLSQTGSETSDYTIDDLIMYNQSDKRKEKVDATALCGEDYSASSPSGTSTGTSDPATEIKIGNYTYPVFNQGSYPNTTKHGGDTISQAGCGLCSLTVCVGGLTGKKVDPVSCGNDTNWTGPKTLAGIAADLKNVYNIDAEALRWDNRTAGGTTPAQKASLTKTKVTEALNNNSPVIALIKPIQAALGTSGNGAHYITLVGLNGNKVIIANSSGGLKEEYDLDWVIEKIYENANTTECGVVITKRSGSSSSSSSTSSGSTSSGNSSSSSSSNNSSSNSNRGGQGKVISTSNLNSTGYTGIYESRTTGRKFKEYKQNGNSYVFRYNISSVNCSWSSECGTVSTMIVGSGYSTKATFEDATKKLKSTGGGTQFTSWLSDYASDAKVKTINSPSQSQLKKLLKEGCVAVVHDPGYSANGHYMAILDISRDGTQIYVSNPDSYNAIQNGWNPISVFYSGGQSLTDCYFVSNKGNVTEYSGDSNEGSEGGADTTCTGTKSGKYYTSLKKTDGLNRIDFMNSNPDIFHRYIREGGEYYEYVGYSRSKLSLSYWNLKNMLQKIYNKKGSLPWAYGKTLGFENIYSSGGNSSSSVGNSSGRGLQAMVDKAIELSKANGGEGVWHYCWGAASGFTHANARFTFSTIDEMNKYIEIGKSAGLDCSAFVLSMYKAYTGADIDPGGAGSTMVSYARSHNGQSLPGSENVTIEYHDSLDDNIQVGDVLFMTGHVGIYAGRDNSGNIMTVDHGGSGSSINCSLADGSNWTGPKYRNGSWFEGYIHYDGLSSGGNGEFLATSGYKVDSNYKGCTYSLTSEERSEFQWIVYNEYGSGGYEGMVYQAQCLRDALINNYNNCTPMTIKDDLRYAYGTYHASKSQTDNNEDAKKAIEYVFDQGGSAIQHRIMFMCTQDYYDNGGWHKEASNGSSPTIEKIVTLGNIIYFDLL